MTTSRWKTLAFEPNKLLLLEAKNIDEYENHLINHIDLYVREDEKADNDHIAAVVFVNSKHDGYQNFNESVQKRKEILHSIGESAAFGVEEKTFKFKLKNDTEGLLFITGILPVADLPKEKIEEINTFLTNGFKHIEQTKPEISLFQMSVHTESMFSSMTSILSMLNVNNPRANQNRNQGQNGLSLIDQATLAVRGSIPIPKEKIRTELAEVPFNMEYESDQENTEEEEHQSAPNLRTSMRR